MNTKNLLARALALSLAGVLSCGVALADKGGGHGKHEKHAAKHEKHAAKHAHKAHKQAQKDARHGVYHAQWDDDGRGHRGRHGSSYRQDLYPAQAGCPPGLAKKHNGCLPPGQARKLAVGQRLPSGVTYHAVPQPVLVQLPAVGPGYRYVRVGNDIVLLSPQSSLVVDILSGRLG